MLGSFRKTVRVYSKQDALQVQRFRVQAVLDQEVDIPPALQGLRFEQEGARMNRLQLKTSSRVTKSTGAHGHPRREAGERGQCPRPFASLRAAGFSMMDT
jgi:hypothetical protein